MKGKKDVTTANNQNNILQFLLKQNNEKINTIKVVEVVNVYDDTVDVRPCLNFLDGDLESVEPNIVFNIPFFTYQCGNKAIKIKPVIGDWGCALVCDSNISKIKNSKIRGNPDNLRKFNLADSLYLGSFIKKQDSNNYIEITENNININSSGEVNIDCSNAKIKGSVEIKGGVEISGDVKVQGIVEAIDCKSGAISGLTHTHIGVMPGNGSSGAAQ